MNILQNKIDDLNLELTLEIAAADYADIFSKRLAEYKRKADFKGFRKGMVPTSMIKRVYGDQCLVEAVNKVVGEGLNNFIKDNNLHIIGEPLGSEKQPEITWEEGKDFSFVFDIALYPEINVEIEKADTVPSYTITPSAKDKSSMTENIKKFYEQKKEEKSDEDIEKEVEEQLKAQFSNEASWRLSKDIHDFYVAKAGVVLPEEFLKRWLIEANEKLTKEDIEKDFARFAEDFKWQLVRGHFAKKFEVKVDEESLLSAAEGYVRYQYAMYGLAQIPDELVKEAAVNMLKDQKQIENLVEQVEEQKVMEKIKSEITLKATKIGSAKFREL